MNTSAAPTSPPSLRDAVEALGIADATPFVPGDATAGTETELHAAVRGHAADVDLPRIIADSATINDLRRRVERGDASPHLLRQLEQFLEHNPDNVWDHSWVVVPLDRLHERTRQRFFDDLRSDAEDPSAPRRGDAERFLTKLGGRDAARLPVSYVLRLALHDHGERAADPELASAARRLAGHFLNDNSSPETHSFHVVALRPGEGGQQVAEEMALRYLCAQLLAAWANEAWGLREIGQEVLVYYASHTPARQRDLNRAVPDAFYRDLFMSPCLSGWRHGEVKHQYMHLCHEVMSRSHLNALPRLRDVGLLGRNLVVLPETSTTALQNNGTHISLGSRGMTEALRSGAATPVHEKLVSDLAIKLSECFLPLFVGGYAADPVRLAFEDFHPERRLGYLVHELSGGDLRRIWWRWRHKAGLGRLGRAWTPFGPPAFDTAWAKALRLPGDWVADYRLLDYLTALPSTERNGAFDGTLGNQERLKRELGELGIFDARMSFYAPIKNREQHRIGFSGVEWRTWSTFPSFARDAAPAVDLQHLITAYAYDAIRRGAISHADFPDDPASESERRLLMFSAAIGLRSFTIRRESNNRWLLDLVRQTPGVRRSARYRDAYKVELQAFRRALLSRLEAEAASLIEQLEVAPALRDARERFAASGVTAADRVAAEVCTKLHATDPLKVDAARFNEAAERQSRTEARQRHIDEALAWLDRSAATGLVRGTSAAWPEARLRLSLSLVRGRPRPDDIRLALDVLLSSELASAERDLLTKQRPS